MRVAIIGSGVSGIGAAKVLKQCGYDVIVYERSKWIGGVWSVGYPDLHLQSHAPQYCYSDFPWPFTPSRHPTGREVLQYLSHAVKFYQIKVKLEHEIISMEEREDGWLLCVRGPIDTSLRFFDYVIVTTGLYTEGKFRPQYPGEEEFEGEICTERTIESMTQFVDKKVVVIGYGKAALDMSTYSSFHSKQTYHIFRIPRWTIPDRIFTIDFSRLLFSRLGTFMITCWTQPHSYARFIQSFSTIVILFWTFIGWLLQFQARLYGLFQSTEIKRRINLTLNSDPLLHDKKFVVAILPSQYYPQIVSEKIVPIRDQLVGFSKDGVKLKSGQQIPCDLVVLALGNQTPSFPFLPEKQRWLMEREGGVQLYRHIIHPRINRMGFIGFNHCYLHINAVEIGTLWLIAAWRGDLVLPSVEDMETSTKRVTKWKEENMAFEPTRAYLILTRFQQYLDTLLLDLGVNPYRKMPNIFNEIFSRYESADYQNVMKEYEDNMTKRLLPLTVSEYDT